MRSFPRCTPSALQHQYPHSALNHDLALVVPLTRDSSAKCLDESKRSRSQSPLSLSPVACVV
jgi:hypothetical protein